jgi:hypothetical protein
MNIFKPTQEPEVWRDHPSYPGYSVSSYGRVRSDGRVVLRRGRPYPIRERILATSRHTQGYVSVGVYVNNVHTKELVHRLVAQTFLDPHDDKVVNHKNGDKTDNRITNLEVVSHGENLQHAYRTMLRTHAQGENWHSARVTIDDVLWIRQYAAENPNNYREHVAQRLGIARPTVSSIVARKSWRHI